MKAKTANSKVFTVLAMVLAGMCLFRVLSVQAADVEEVYSSKEPGTQSEEDDTAPEVDTERAEIRLSRPDEAALRIADEQGYDLVPGIERLIENERAQAAIQVPTRDGRKIASEPSPNASTSTESVSTNTYSNSNVMPSAPLTSGPMEPRAFTANDAANRAAEHRSENIVAAQAPQYGLRAEPRFQTRIDAPLPARTEFKKGVQEVSVIVSDHGYFPNRIFVTQNIPVKLYMSTPGKATMCFMVDTWGVKKGVSPGKVEEVVFTPDAPGDYRFYCPMKSIEGTITVREWPVTDQATRGVAGVRETAGIGNEPKNAGELRALIED